MITDTEIVEQCIEHPLEEVFNIEPCTTVVERTEKSTDLIETEEYDAKDNEIESQLQEVYDYALAGYEDRVAEAEVVSVQFRARTMEVGVQLLNTALAAVKEKSHMKQHKDKAQLAKGKMTGGTINNNLIVADRNILLKQLMGEQSDDTLKEIN